MSKISGYDLIGYGSMVQSEPRMSAYAAALRGAVTPGCTVIDLGAGPGVFAILACVYGAGKVVAIDPDPAINLLHQLAHDNGFSDRIEIIQGKSTDYTPSSKADVIVSDLRGVMPLYEGHVASIKDARERLLAPGGILIPARDQIRIAAVESPATYQEFDEPWRSNAYDIDLSAGTRFVVNRKIQVSLGEENLLGNPQHLATLDYQHIVDPNLRSKVTLPIARKGLVHGLLLWFDAELADDASFSNAPGQPPQVYRQMFCPLERPLMVGPGDTLHAEIMGNLIDGSYVWSWNTAVARGVDGIAEPLFRQSTFLSTIFQPGQMKSHADVSVPRKNEKMAIDAFCLSLIDGERSLKAITDAVMAQYPDAFSSPADGLNHVSRLAGQYDKK